MHSLIKAILCAGLFLSEALLAAPLPMTVPNPVKDTAPYVKEDELKVLVFFKFTCPICRNYHMTLDYWGKSLPRPFELQFIPVLEGDGRGNTISDESARASMMFWAVERSGNRAQRALFADAAYELSQDPHGAAGSEAWMQAASNTEIQKSKFKSAWDAERVTWPSRVERQIHYKPTATPTLVICGKWMITPDSTNGDSELFMQLANGLVSKCIMEKGLSH